MAGGGAFPSVAERVSHPLTSVASPPLTSVAERVSHPFTAWQVGGTKAKGSFTPFHCVAGGRHKSKGGVHSLSLRGRWAARRGRFNTRAWFRYSFSAPCLSLTHPGHRPPYLSPGPSPLYPSPGPSPPVSDRSRTRLIPRPIARRESLMHPGCSCAPGHPARISEPSSSFQHAIPLTLRGHMRAPFL